MSYTEQEQLEEQNYLLNIVATFQRYEQFSISANNRRRKDFLRLPQNDRELLESTGWKKKLDRVDAAIQANARFLGRIVVNPEIYERDAVQSGDEEEEVAGGEPQDHFPHNSSESHSHDHAHSIGSSFGHSHSHGSTHNSDLTDSHTHTHTHTHNARSFKPNPIESDMDKLRSTLKQLVRDWGEEGKLERDTCYLPMTEALLEYYSHVPESERRNYRVLVPGAGLARLTLDVAKLGFTCQGNEFSHYMLLASYFILNRTQKLHEHTIYPYIHSFSNTLSSSYMLRPVTIPDVLPSDIPPGSDFSLVAGDFEEIYGAQENDPRGHESQVGKWDAILTCFFIDTAKNIINYLRIIHRILRPDGVWINLGPLLWHFENNASGDASVEVDLEEIKSLANKIGFDIQQERVIETSYTSDRKSMLGYIYKAEFWVATKKQPNSEKPNN